MCSREASLFRLVGCLDVAAPYVTTHEGDIVIAAQTEMMRHEKGTVRAYLLGFAWTYLMKDNPHY